MNPHDKAYELARSIRESSAFQRALQAKQAIERDPSASQLVKEFKLRQFQLQSRQMFNQSVPEDEMMQLQKLSEIIQMNVDARNYLEADAQVQTLMMDLQRILSDVADEIAFVSPYDLFEGWGNGE